MENSRQSSMAQLSAWTEVMKKSGKPAIEHRTNKHVAELDEEYEDEFEEYDEDFETETPVKAPQKTSISPRSHVEPIRLRYTRF